MSIDLFELEVNPQKNSAYQKPAQVVIQRDIPVIPGPKI